MIKVESNEKLPIKMWLSEIENEALNQAKNLANLPFAFRHIALMPDSHSGYGMPIGGVLATHKTIVPNAVGVDIGCGMCAMRTNIKETEKSDLQKIIDIIKELVPVGFNWHKEKQSENMMPEKPTKEDAPIVNQQYEPALMQVGTLGGGNHFIELQQGSDGYLWAMIHSGSRNIGKKVADHYNKVAKELNELWFSSVPKEWDLAYLPFDTKEARLYFREMQYCVDFAFANRKQMMNKIKVSLQEVLPNIVFDEIINIAHNYAAWENHFNNNVIIHRKGATRAYSNEIGIVPGSMGTKSYIVRGLGNNESFKSCSHGAGRIMGRKQAQRTLDLLQEQKMLNKQNIIHDVDSIDKLDEAPSAYKNIDTVMSNQNDLVEIVVELKPLAVMKG